MYLKITPWISSLKHCKMRFRWPLSRRRILALVQGISSLRQQKLWLTSLATVMWDLGRALACTLCSWVQFNAKVTEQVANPAGLGAVLLSHSCPPGQLLHKGRGVLYRNRLLLEGSVATGGKAQLSVVNGPGTGTLETKRLKRQQPFCACLCLKQ